MLRHAAIRPQHMAPGAARGLLDAPGEHPYSPATFETPSELVTRVLKLLTSIFTWWGGATIGARFHIGRRGVLVGTDDYGNSYYEARDKSDAYDGNKRRWVIYTGYAEASKVPPEWHGWLRNTFADPPTVAPLLRRSWEKDHLPNLTGTVHAWRPQGAIARGGERQATTGDYQAWKPE